MEMKNIKSDIQKSNLLTLKIRLSSLIVNYRKQFF
jgi:hypothetical protein